MKDKKYKVTCEEIGYEDTIKASNEEDAQCDALSDIGLNIQEYIEIDVEEVKWNNSQSKLNTPPKLSCWPSQLN